MMARMRIAIALILVVAMLAACEGGGTDIGAPPSPGASSEEPAAASSPAGVEASVTPPADTGCPNQQAAIEDPSNFEPGELVSDVDADGNADVVRLAVDEDGEPGCGAFLVVETARGTLMATPAEETGAPGTPRLNRTAAIDERDGAEIVVDLVAGASTQFVGVFSAGSGALARMSVAEGPYGDLFPHGGSVGHLEASDCSGEPGEVVMSIATPRGSGYRIERTFYLSDSGTFGVTDRERIRIDDLQDLESFQEFIGSPFGTCPV